MPYLQDIFLSVANLAGFLLDQGFPNWGTCTPSGIFAYLKGCI